MQLHTPIVVLLAAAGFADTCDNAYKTPHAATLLPIAYKEFGR
jgi:hypothetical protein